MTFDSPISDFIEWVLMALVAKILFAITYYFWIKTIRFLSNEWFGHDHVGCKIVAEPNLREKAMVPFGNRTIDERLKNELVKVNAQLKIIERDLFSIGKRSKFVPFKVVDKK